ncbi:hypothetical protein O9993_22915 [Vibrio lentus]|nr:hypothetical protein [Vibrio lentus]
MKVKTSTSAAANGFLMACAVKTHNQAFVALMMSRPVFAILEN